MKKIVKKFLFIILLFFLISALLIADYYNLLPQKKYYNSDFSIETVYSEVDYNNNGKDDYTDFLLGAKKDAQNKPRYDGSYVEGGFPSDDVGVCTDVIWRSFKMAGYNLRDMIDNDVSRRREDYIYIDVQDCYIDFRRVGNLRIFFEKYAIILTNDISQIDQFQPGDIVIFNGNDHIGIVSDIRNSKGVPYIIHNGGQPVREEDYLKRNPQISGHYRFDSSLIDQEILVKWED